MNVNAYRETQVSTLPQPLWPSAAYAGVLTLIGRAERAIRRGDAAAAHEALTRAQQIVQVLRTSLRPDGAGLSERLDSLYQYVLGQLAQANLNKDAAGLQMVAQVLGPLREAWETAGRQAIQSGAGAVPIGGR
jgi:flagellar protein FliS